MPAGRTAAAAAAVALAALCCPSPAGAVGALSVRFDLATGRVGGLQLGVAKEAQVLARFGKPKSVTHDLGGVATDSRRLMYRCGSGCTLAAELDGADTLQLVWAYLRKATTRKQIRTSAGTYLGLSQASAERREKRRMRPGCVMQMSRTVGDVRLEVGAQPGYVDSIVMATSKAYVLC